MTTYELESTDESHLLLASWPDLPERASHPVATFADLKLASVSENGARSCVALPVAATGATSRRRCVRRDGSDRPARAAERGRGGRLADER